MDFPLAAGGCQIFLSFIVALSNALCKLVAHEAEAKTKNANLLVDYSGSQ